MSELAVDLDRAPELDVLGVDDPLQNRGHDLQVGHFLRDPDQWDPVLVSLADHLGRDLGQVPLGFDDQAGGADSSQVAHQVALSLPVVLDGEGDRKQQLALREPADRVRGLEDLDPGDCPVQPARSSQDFPSPQSTQPHRLAHRERHGSD